MAQYKIFDFTPEIINSFREKGEIPVHFYNKDGQILIYKKENASESEIDRLLRFVQQGIYYDVDDTDVLGLGKKKKEGPEQTEEGLSDVKLLSENHAQALSSETTELFSQLKTSSIDAFQARKAGQAMQKVFTDFESQPDAMNGLVNILELMNAQDDDFEVELAVKRTVVAMAMKTRGMKATNYRDQRKMDDMVNVLMMAALLCDVGASKMQMPTGAQLSAQELEYVQNHPLMSYLMIAHEPTIDPRIKRNILVHHRPLRAGAQSNNYPDMRVLVKKLVALEEKYRGDPARQAVAIDIQQQLMLLKKDLPYDEDANILAVASEFASLTSTVPWRESFTAEEATCMIINNSFFTYTDRIVREFLDHVAMSMNDNQKILKEGDFIIVAARGTGQTYFEVCIITSVGRYQSKPGIDRIATIYPEIGRSPKWTFLDFNIDKLRPDPRYAHYELAKDDSRHIIFVVRPNMNEALYERLVELTAGRRNTPVEPSALGT